MLDQRLAEHAHSLLAGAADRFMRLLAGNMHDVDRNAGGVGNGDGAIGRLALHLGRARIGVRLGAGNARRHELLLQRGDEVAILRMDERQGPERGAALERREHLVIVHHQGALIGHEVLERVDAAADRRGHVVENLLRPAGDGHMEGIVAAGLAGSALFPQVERFHHAVLAGDDEVHHQGRAARKRGVGAALPGLGGGRAHEGHFEMRVRIDAARYDQRAFGIDHRFSRQARSDSGDLLAFDEDIGLVAAIRRNDGAAFDYLGHAVNLCCELP